MTAGTLLFPAAIEPCTAPPQIQSAAVITCFAAVLAISAAILATVAAALPFPAPIQPTSAPVWPCTAAAQALQVATRRIAMSFMARYRSIQA
jgi:hypothetical protein